MHKNEVCISGVVVIYSGTVRKGRQTNSRDPVYEIKPADSKNTMTSALKRILL